LSIDDGIIYTVNAWEQKVDEFYFDIWLKSSAINKNVKSFEEFKEEIKTQAKNEHENKNKGVSNIRGADLAHL